MSVPICVAASGRELVAMFLSASEAKEREFSRAGQGSGNADDDECGRRCGRKGSREEVENVFERFCALVEEIRFPNTTRHVMLPRSCLDLVHHPHLDSCPLPSFLVRRLLQRYIALSPTATTHTYSNRIPTAPLEPTTPTVARKGLDGAHLTLIAPPNVVNGSHLAG